MQLVNIVEGGERARMSKRRGEFVTLDELIDDIGADATRFFLLQRSHDTAVDLDLDLARSTSQDNPVYYVQYAHARIASILRKAAGESGPAAADAEAIAAAAAGEPARLAPGGADRAGARPPAPRAPGRGRSGRGAPGPAQAVRLRDGHGGRLPRLLPRLSRRRRRAGHRGGPPRPLRGHHAHDRDHARAPRRQRAGAHVGCAPLGRPAPVLFWNGRSEYGERTFLDATGLDAYLEVKRCSRGCHAPVARLARLEARRGSDRGRHGPGGWLSRPRSAGEPHTETTPPIEKGRGRFL